MQGKIINSNILISSILIIILSTFGVAFIQKDKAKETSIEAKEFRADELYTSQINVNIEQIINQLPNSSVWNSFLASNKDGYAHIYLRSGRPVSLTYVFPFIPGTSGKNNITLKDLSRSLGYEVKRITDDVIRDVARKFVKDYAALLNINPDEIGEIRVGNPVDYIWQIYITRQVQGIPVRYSNITLIINHGNLILWGVEKWGDIKINLTSSISKVQAIKTGFDYIGGRLPIDNLVSEPHLEIIPIESRTLSLGKGYDHILAWVYSFRREGYNNTWEVIIDAHKSKIIAFQDLNQYAAKKIIGSIYPLTNDECPPTGVAAVGIPMPYVNTGFAAPNDYTDLGGKYNYTSGTATTTLNGRYVIINENCGAVSESSTTGDINLGGISGQHDCTVPAGHSAGDTFAARTCSSEITRINRIARGWVNYAWLDTPITCNTNINNTCNAYYYNNTINFYRSGGGCGNTGEIASALDHEWGHAIDDYDINGIMSNPSNSIADIVAILRLHTSCFGEGFININRGCGWFQCPGNPAIYKYYCSDHGDCCTNCSGVRDLDYAKHISGTPRTPANFICVKCGIGSGPCGKDDNCESIVMSETAWDIATRDLQSAPFNYDKQTAFELATRLAYIGSGNVSNWYACACPSTSNGCGATNGYMQWIGVDDDNGNINDGTPHMTAIYNAFNRHGIACHTPTAQNSGCSGGPTTAPTLTATPGNNSVSLSWNAVPGSTQYHIFRTEGPLATNCDFGKIKLASTSSTSFTDTQALNNFTFYYQVMPVGSNTACLGPLSNCVNATPIPCSSCAAYLSGSAKVINITGDDSDEYMDNCEAAKVQVSIQNIGTGIAQNVSVDITSPNPFITITTQMPIYVGNIPVGETANTTFEFTIGQGASKATCQQSGTFNISVQATGQEPAATDSFGFTYEVDLFDDNKVYSFEPETGLEGWTVTGGTWQLSTERYNPGGSTASVHSSANTNLQCDYFLSPELEATNTTQLIIPNWYDIEPQSGSTWYDRANVWIVQGANKTLVNPSSGKLYQTGNFYNWSYCDMGTNPGWAGRTTGNFWGDSTFSLGSFEGQKFRIEIRYMTDDLTSYEGIYVDDIRVNNVKLEGCDQQSDSCVGANPPGKVSNSLTISKSGVNLILTWTAPDGTCNTNAYGVYRGSLPINGSYTHSFLNCSVSETTYTDTDATGSHYYLIAPNNISSEGSYGTSFNGSTWQEIPQAETPCNTQNTNEC